jgi:hypothetical protein
MPKFHHELLLFLLLDFLNTLISFFGYDIMHCGSVSTLKAQESLFHPEGIH